MLISSVVDWKALGEVVIAAFVAGIGVTAVFAVAILGVTRFADVRRAGGAPGLATGYAILAAVALGVCAAAVVFGIVEMARK